VGNRSREVVNIWCDWLEKFIGKKRHGAFSPKLSESPSSETTSPIEKKIKGCVQKWYGQPLSLCKVWWRSAAARRREKEKLGVFSLFVMLCIVNLNKVLAHQWRH